MQFKCFSSIKDWRQNVLNQSMRNDEQIGLQLTHLFLHLSK